MTLGTLLLLDGAALGIAAGGIALISRRAATPDAAYPQRILGALLIGIALFLGGFTTAADLS